MIETPARIINQSPTGAPGDATAELEPKKVGGHELRAAWAGEHRGARLERARGQHAAEWAHLERAHILSQPMAGPHLRTHLAMLGYGLRHHAVREVVGQVLRLTVAAPGSWTGRYPAGNTGGSDVSALKPLPVPYDLQALLNPSAPAAETGAHPHIGTNRALRWGVLFGVLQAALPVAFWWLAPAFVHALLIAFIAAVYVGFAVSDGRPRVIFVESLVAAGFVVLAASAVTATAWLLVAAYVADGIKDLWQHRRQFVRGTRWWPPFCVAIDWTVAAIVVVQILAGSQLQP